MHTEATSGVLLLLSAVVALAWANSPWSATYYDLWHYTVGIRLGEFTFDRTLEWVVNDGLMVVFFFVVGMEIRREIYEGELSEWRRAALPMAAALGGMVVPAGLYLSLANSPSAHHGWGVPMATDIAFAVGILTLLGKRVPAALRVLLLALAVIDDLGAIIVIALFYSSGIAAWGFLAAALGFGVIFLLQRFGVRSKWIYVLPAVFSWAGIYASGVHPTIAGVLVGLMTPVKAWLGPEGFLADMRRKLVAFADELGRSDTHEMAVTLRQVNYARREALSPAASLIDALHPWVAFGIMPLFALANAGVQIESEAFDPARLEVAMGVVFGLVVGKPLGVVGVSFIALKLRLVHLPRGLTMKHLVVLGIVAGVGFTMSLFIAQLAFTDAASLAAAKLGVLIASTVAGVMAMTLGRLILPNTVSPESAATVDDAERSTEL